MAIWVLFIQGFLMQCLVLLWHSDWVPVHHWGTSSCYHGPDPASGVEQGQFEAGTTLGIKVGNVGLLQKSEKTSMKGGEKKVIWMLQR